MEEHEVSSFKKSEIIILAFLIFGFISIYLYPGVDRLPTVQAMWDQTIEYRNQGLDDIKAMSLIWNNKAPEATIDDLADIFSAVYADTYWVQTKMDPVTLSGNMQCATNLRKPICDRAAKAAFSQWRGILTRYNFKDTGHIPKHDSFTNSPDVACNRSALDIMTLLKKWNQRFWTCRGLTNYLYVRGFNSGFPGEIKKAQVRMFYTDPGFNSPPTSWNIIYAQDQKIYLPMEGMEKGPLSEGDRAAAGPFLLDLSKTGQFSIIAVVSTEFFKNDPTEIPGGNWNSLEWIKNNGAAAWRNTSVHNKAESLLKFYNQDGRPERFAFEAHCFNVPSGTVVSLKCRDPKVPALDSGPVKIHKKYQLVSIEAEVPANNKGDLIVGIKGPRGKLLPARASVEVQMKWILEHGHKHYIQAADMLGVNDAARVSQDIRVPMGNYTFLGKLKGPKPLKDIQAMWDQTIEYQQQGLKDTAAMQLIWPNKPTGATLNDLAGIFGAVYADTYWSQTKMDPAILAGHMHLATGLRKSRCNKAAKAAFSQWCGTLVRKNFKDFGKIPNTAPLTVSPDVVCNGDVELTREILIKNWSDTFWDDPQMGTNFFYTRCANLGFLSPITKAKVRMFYTDQGLNIPPKSWKIMRTKDGNNIYSPMQGMARGPLKIGDRAASDAFLFNPSALGGYCFITVVSTEFFKNDPTTIPEGNWNMAEWINNNGAVGAHSYKVPTKTESKLKFYNQDSRPERFAFEAHCDNVPIGTVVSLESRDPKVALDTGRVKVTKKSQIVGTEAVLPSLYNGDLIVRIQGPEDKFLPTGAVVDVRMVWLLEHGHKYYLKAAKMLDAHDAANASQVMQVPMGSCIIYGVEK